MTLRDTEGRRERRRIPSPASLTQVWGVGAGHHVSEGMRMHVPP